MFSETVNGKTIQLIKGKESIAQVVFTVAIVLELVVMMTDHLASWTLPYRGRVTHVAFVLFCVKILMTRYDLKQAGVAALAGMLGVISYCTCKDEYVIRAVVFVAAAVGVDAKRNLKIILWGASIGSAIIILLSLFGICGKVVDVRHYGRGMVEARYCLGFNHANNVHDMLWYIISLYLLLRRDKTKWYEYLIMLAVNIGLYVLTVSRTGFITTMIVVLGALAVRYISFVRNGLITYIVCLGALAASVALTIYGSMYNIGERKFVAIVDRILTGRLEMLTEHANFKEWELFPASRTAELVDNGFSFMTYGYGTAIGLLLVIEILIKIILLIHRRDSLAAVVFTGAILVTFMEATFVINVSLLCNMVLIIIPMSGFVKQKQSTTNDI